MESLGHKSVCCYGQRPRLDHKANPAKFGFVLQHGNGSSYQDGTVDFFGLVILPLHTVYIVPKLSMNGRMKAYVYPENLDSAGLLERYRENWGLL